MRLRSTETFSGMHSVTGKPSAAPIMAKAMPVLPLVASSRILPGANFPLRRAFGHDVRSGAVFHRSPGIDPLGFAQQFDAGQVAGDALQPQQRRVADALQAAPAQQVHDSERLQQMFTARVYMARCASL